MITLLGILAACVVVVAIIIEYCYGVGATEPSVVLGRRRQRSRNVLTLLSIALLFATANPFPFDNYVVVVLALAHAWSLAFEASAAAAMLVEQAPVAPWDHPHQGASPASPAEPPRARASTSPRPPTPPERLATPVLQAKLRQALGQNARLPKQKAELVALFRQHGLQ